MNIKSFYIGCVSLVVAGLFSACSSSYLDVEPITDINDTQLADPSVLRTAPDGIYESMNTQYSGIDFNQNCGEAYISYLMNDCAGIDLISGMWNNPANSGMTVWDRIAQDTEFPSSFTWSYYYGLVGQANRIIAASSTKNEDGSEIELDPQVAFCRASALTMRAHAYQKLMVYFSQRWEDSNEGEAYCIVLRTEPTDGNLPLVKMNAVYDQIYADCEEAVSLFEKAGVQRNAKYEVDANVANGIWARAALMKHDWRTAADKAEAAMKGYSIMTEKDLFAGFISDNKDLIWCMNPSEKGVYYWSWGSHYSCNGGYVNNWNFGAGAINIDLYNLLDKNDLRRKFFWMPDKLEALSKRENPGKLKAKDFWNDEMVNPAQFLNMTWTNVYKKTGKGNYGMVDAVVNWLADYLDNVFTGDRSAIAPTDAFYNYMYVTNVSKSSTKSVRLSKDASGNDRYGTPVNVPFGAQCKLWSVPPYGSGMYPWMRASEMALTRAEALCELGDASAAQVFEEFQKQRVPGYKCRTTGAALLEEIRVSRRVELWGEGHNFTDIKRWNMPHIHREWVKGDVNSGNWAPGEGLTEYTMSPKYSNGWRFAFPAREYRYNPEVDRSLLPVIE